jgi:hypothetical protein
VQSLTRRQIVTDLALISGFGTLMPTLAMGSAPRRVGPRPTTGRLSGIEDPISLTMSFADGSSKVYSESEAVDLGSYHDPAGQFVQLCRMASRPDEPWSVFFRPDQGSERFEVIVELGWPGMEARHAPPYRASISRGGRQVANVSVGAHYWWSRWRWQSQSRPVRKTPAELMAAKSVPPMGRALPGRPTDPAKAATYSPMIWGDLSLMGNMDAGGEREEIGLLTERQGEWLCTGGARALGMIMAQADAHGSVPVHFRDESMAPISIQRYSQASTFWTKVPAQADPWLNRLESPIAPDKAHYPTLNYVPFLATGDAYYLEEIQFAAQFHLLNYNTAYRQRDKGILGDEQVRGWAWGIRALFQAVAATPSRVPAWLAPKAYFQTILANNRAWFTETQVRDRSHPMRSVCHFAINPDGVGPWQQDFLSAVFGWAVMAGFDDWRPAYEWHIQQALTRALGRHGYPRSQAVHYYYNTKGATDWASLAAISSLTATQDGNFPANVDRSYAGYLRGALALAKRNDVPGASEAFAYADAQVRRLGTLAFRWAFEG